MWKIIKIIITMQVFNALMDYLVLISYNYQVSSLTLATLDVFYTVLILSITVALDRESKTAEITRKSQL